MKDQPQLAALIAAALILSIIAIIAAVVAIVETERNIKDTKSKMTPVYGLSFMNLPHAPLDAVPLQRTAVGAPFQFQPTQVAGSSFSHMMG